MHQVNMTSTFENHTLAVQLQVMFMQLERLLRQEYRRNNTSRETETVGPILGLLNELGAISPGEIASWSFLPTPSVSRTINHLINAEEISLIPHPTDKRSRLLQINPRTKEIIQKHRQQNYAILTGTNEYLREDEKQLIHQTTEIIVKFLAIANGQYSYTQMLSSEPVRPFVQQQDLGTLRAFTMHASRYLRKQAFPQSLNATQYFILDLIEHFEQITPSDLSELEHLPRSSVTQMLIPLTEMGFIQDLGGSIDSRYKYKGLTETGTQLLAQIKSQQSQKIESMLHLLSFDEHQILLKGVKLLNKRTAIN